MLESRSDSRSDVKMRGNGGGSLVCGDVTGVEDNEEIVESSENWSSDVQLRLCKRTEACSEPWKWR